MQEKKQKLIIRNKYAVG